MHIFRKGRFCLGLIHPTQEKDRLVDVYAASRCSEARENLKIICDRSNFKHEIIDTMIENIQQNANIAIHFHPDIVNFEGKSVLENLLEGGISKSMKPISPLVCLDPTVDGRRVQWEDMLLAMLIKEWKIFLRPYMGLFLMAFI